MAVCRKFRQKVFFVLKFWDDIGGVVGEEILKTVTQKYLNFYEQCCCNKISHDSRGVILQKNTAQKGYFQLLKFILPFIKIEVFLLLCFLENDFVLACDTLKVPWDFIRDKIFLSRGEQKSVNRVISKQKLHSTYRIIFKLPHFGNLYKRQTLTYSFYCSKLWWNKIKFEINITLKADLHRPLHGT